MATDFPGDAWADDVWAADSWTADSWDDSGSVPSQPVWTETPDPTTGIWTETSDPPTTT